MCWIYIATSLQAAYGTPASRAILTLRQPLQPYHSGRCFMRQTSRLLFFGFDSEHFRFESQLQCTGSSGRLRTYVASGLLGIHEQGYQPSSTLRHFPPTLTCQRLISIDTRTNNFSVLGQDGKDHAVCQKSGCGRSLPRIDLRT